MCSYWSITIHFDSPATMNLSSFIQYVSDMWVLCPSNCLKVLQVHFYQTFAKQTTFSRRAAHHPQIPKRFHCLILGHAAPHGTLAWHFPFSLYTCDCILFLALPLLWDASTRAAWRRGGRGKEACLDLSWCEKPLTRVTFSGERVKLTQFCKYVTVAPDKMSQDLGYFWQISCCYCYLLFFVNKSYK